MGQKKLKGLDDLESLEGYRRWRMSQKEERTRSRGEKEDGVGIECFVEGNEKKAGSVEEEGRGKGVKYLRPPVNVCNLALRATLPAVPASGGPALVY